jgi:hypothetical protein
MRRGRWAAIAAAVAIVAAAAVSAGCGGGSGNALALDPVAAAATKTQHAGAARISFALALSSPQMHGGQTVRLHGTGAVDGTSSTLAIDLGSLPSQAGLPAGASMKVISLQQNGDYVVFVRVGALTSHLPAGKHWVELDLSKLGKSAGVDRGSLLSGSQVQPGDLLSMLKAEGATIRKLGSATVDGVPTTHYRVTIEVAKALQAKGLPGSLLAGLAAKAPKTVPAEVWIGNDGLVHRLQISLGLAQSHFGLTMDLSDYGTHVTIAAPPSGDVFDATQLAAQGFGGSFH